MAFAFALGACSGSSGGGAAASAQDAAGGGGAGTSAANGRHRMAQALASLGLSDDQKSQIRAIMGAARKESAGADPATRRANYKAAIAKIDSVLTPDQLTKWHAKLAEMRKERQPGASPQS
jgi:Spy/CpxP family protein refolding chaperone